MRLRGGREIYGAGGDDGGAPGAAGPRREAAQRRSTSTVPGSTSTGRPRPMGGSGPSIHPAFPVLLLLGFLVAALWPDLEGMGLGAAAAGVGGLLGRNAQLLAHDERVALRDEAKAMFDHAYGNYMAHAYPLDELMPLSCKGRDWRKRDRGTLDDPLGGYALTLVDTLDMLAVLGDYDRFWEAVQLVIRDVHFDRDITISVFEATIRVLGGLLSAHSLLRAEELAPVFAHRTPTYQDELLHLARDMGNRLLPAFETKTGLPIHRVNLRTGVPPGETRETCTAAAGTLILELGLLSRLTGDPRYERASRRALRAIWDRRSAINLVGSTIHAGTGKWLQRHSGIGAGIDSFYEYLLKAYVMFGDEELLQWFNTAYAAVQDHTLWGPWNVEVSMVKGKWQPYSFHVSSLSAFWPGLQVLAGELPAARTSFRAFYSLWQRYRALPELFDVKAHSLLHFGHDYPLRPELIESAYHLYAATRDPYYLTVGKEFLFSLQNRTRVPCGYASVAHVSEPAKGLDDRMDSFFLSETLKYLFLLFDASLEPAQQSSVFCPLAGSTGTSNSSSTAASSSPRPCIPMVRTLFTTEGHVFFVEGRNSSSSSSSEAKGSEKHAHHHDLLVAESAGAKAPLHSHLVPPPHSGSGSQHANGHPHAAVGAAREAASRRGRRSHRRALEEGAGVVDGGGHGERHDTCALPMDMGEDGDVAGGEDSFLAADGDAADLYAGMNGFVVEEPLASLSDEELLAHLNIFPANLGGGEGGGGLSSGTPESFTAFSREVLQAFRSLHLQQHLEAFTEGAQDAPLLSTSDSSISSSGGGIVSGDGSEAALHAVAGALFSPTPAVAAAAAAAQASTAASIASGVLFQCDKAERKCKLGRLARSPVSVTFYVPPAPAPAPTKRRRPGSFVDEEEEEEEGKDGKEKQEGPAGMTREDFFALASASPEAVITQVEYHMQPGFQGLGFPGQFGTDLRQTGPVYGFLAIPRRDAAEEWRGGDGPAGFFVDHDGCTPFSRAEAARVKGRVAVLLRGGCSFASKARRIEEAGGVGVILVDLEELDFEAIFEAKTVVASQQQQQAAAAAAASEQDGGKTDQPGKKQQQQQQQQQRNPVYTSWQVMSDDGAGVPVGIPATLVTGLNAQVMLECMWWYMRISPVAPKAARPEETVYVRLAYDDVMAIEDGEIMDLGPPSAPERPQSMLDRVLGGLAELLGGGVGASTHELEKALDSLGAEAFEVEDEEEEEEVEEEDEEAASDEEEEGSDLEDEEEDWEEEDEEGEETGEAAPPLPNARASAY